MPGFIDVFKEKLNNFKFSRLLPCCLAVLFIVLQPVQAYATSSVYTGVLQNSWQFTNESKYFTFSAFHSGGEPDVSYEPFQITEDINGNITFYYNSGSFDNTVNRLYFYNLGSRFAIDFAPELFDYYLIFTVFNSYSENLLPHTSPLDLGSYPKVSLLYADYGIEDYHNLSTVDYSSASSSYDFFKFSSSDTVGYNFVTKINPRLSDSSWPCGLAITSVNSFPCVGNVLAFKGVIVATEKDDTSVTSILSYLRSIDTNLSNFKSDFSSFLELYYFVLISGFSDIDGNSGSMFGQDTESILGGLIGNTPQLNDYVNQYTQVEKSMTDKFTQNQTAVRTNFSNWSWGSLSTAVDWTSDYLNRIYDNSGDFRTMFMYPILAGIALIFIGRQGMAAYIRSRNNKKKGG